MATLPVGNWTSYVQDFVKDKDIANFIVGNNPNFVDPAYGCEKEFTASYQCGDLPQIKTIDIPGEAFSKSAVFDCTKENKSCSGFRLTLGDDGNLVLKNIAGSQIWTSNTNKTGLALDEFKATNGKFGRNYLLSGETLNLGEFVGSPSGNCYLIMAPGTDGGNGLQLNYSVSSCTAQNFGNDEDTNGLFSLAKTAYNELIGAQNQVTPKMATLRKTQRKEDNIFMDQKQQINKKLENYTGFNNTKPLLKKHIKQLEAMDEDTLLYLIRYKYRRIAWFTLALVILLGGLKMLRSNNA